MSDIFSRRGFLAVTPAVGLGALAVGGGLAVRTSRAGGAEGAAPAGGAYPGGAQSRGAPVGPTLPHFPALDPALAQQVVGLSHRSLEGVTKLVDRQPTLANATWDWGFGDWETALGAASHTGQREIALYLLAKGARPDIFAFAMLGNLDAVRAIVAGSPGAQRTRGPHGIPLLAHAEAGGDAAKPVAEYLRALGDADGRATSAPLSDADRDKYVGAYSFGPGPTDRVEIKAGKVTPLTLERPGSGPRNLFHVGDHAFHPAGAPAVRIVFVVEGGRAARLECFDPDRYLTAQRV